MPYPLELSKYGRSQLAIRIDLEMRAEKILALIVAEFKSDPKSVQCFDLRIVKEAIEVSDKLNKMP